MTLQAINLDKVQFSTNGSGHDEAAVHEYIADIRRSPSVAEAATAQAHVQAGAAGEGASEPANPVSIAARLLEFAQAAADEQLAVARTEAERVVAEARVLADKLVADAHNQAEAAKATAEQTADRVVQTARAKEAESAAHVARLQETEQCSRRDLRELAQQLTEIADANQGAARP